MTTPPKPRLIAAAFFGVLWLLFAGTWFEWGQFDPPGDAGPASLNLYVRDHFGFRGWLVTLNAFVRAKLLHTSTSPKVLIGKNGFLFYAAEGALETYMGTNPMTDCELESWVRLFERRADWLAARNIPFLVALAPEKQSIYPELMPYGVPRSQAPTRTSQFVEAIMARTRIPIIDLRAVLLGEKEKQQVYLPTDTHWNPSGAYAAYRELIRRMGMEAAPYAAITPQPPTLPGDLTRMLGLGLIASPVTINVDVPLSVSGTSKPGEPRLVMFRDSFGVSLVPYLGRHFSRVYAPMSWSFDPSIVMAERPGFVLIELLERRLNEAPPIDPGLPSPQSCEPNAIQTLRR